MPDESAAIYTVGHGAVAAEELAAILKQASVESVVDVRRYPGSRRHPQYERTAMAVWLQSYGIGYRWEERLGGRRRPSPDSINLGLRNAQFRAYADHMAGAEFRDAIADLLGASNEGRTAIMCSESVWWRCHRRLVADHLVLVESRPVVHIFHDGRTTAHEVTKGARLEGDRVVYGEPTLPLH